MKIELTKNGYVLSAIDNVAKVWIDTDIYGLLIVKFRVMDDELVQLVPDDYEVMITGNNATIKMMRNNEVFREFNRMDYCKSYLRDNGTGYCRYAVKDAAREYFCEPGQNINWWSLELEEV